MRRITAVITAALVAASLAACGSSDTNKDSAHTADAKVDTSAPIKNVAFPDGYRNVVVKPDGYGNLIYNTHHDGYQASDIEIAPDPSFACKAK